MVSCLICFSDSYIHLHIQQTATEHYVVVHRALGFSIPVVNTMLGLGNGQPQVNMECPKGTRLWHQRLFSNAVGVGL